MSDHTTSQPEYKTCPVCGISKPRTAEYFHRDESRPIGFSRTCKDCARERTRRWREAHPARAEEWRKENPEYQSIWYQDNRQAHLERTKKRYDADPDRKLATNKSWREKHPAETKSIGHRRRAKRRGLPASLTGDQWIQALEYFGYRCAICGRPQGLWHTLAQDHWIPINYDGDDNPGTVATNVIPLCHGLGGCNNSKADKLPKEWLTQMYGGRKAKRLMRKVQAYFEWIR